MIYNYTILSPNHYLTNNFKFENIYNKQENNNYINKSSNGYIKLLVVLLLIIIISLEINHADNLEKYEFEQFSDGEKKDNIFVNFRKNIFWNYTFLKNEMHYYELYNILRIPKISLIILNDEKVEKDINEIQTLLMPLFSQNFTNIEIILNLKNKKDCNYIEQNKELHSYINHGMLKIEKKTNNIKDCFANLINLSKGIYTVFINNLSSINFINIQQLFNYTKNNVNNYISFKISNYSSNYLIKTKLLKDMIDNGTIISSLNMIFDIVKTIKITNFNYVHISFCPDNNFTNLVYVSMISVLSSKNSDTFICFYLIIPHNFKTKNINFLQTLYEDYDYFNITYITLDERYDNAYTDNRITKQAYYRFSLGELIKNLNKIIYFDTDVIVYKDLNKFYNLNFNGKMILGQPTYGNKNYQKHGFNKINTGVLLLNLLEMRKNKFERKVIKLVGKGIKFSYHDQTLLNDYFKQYLGTFPPEYHIRPWSNYKEMEIFNKKIGKVFDQDYFFFSHKYPTIRHFLGAYKPRNPNINHIEDWWFFARKSKYYNKKARIFQNAFSY